MAAALFGLRLRAVRVRRVFGDRDIKIERVVLDRELESRGHDANHGVRTPVERDGASDHIRIRAEMFFPKIIIDDHLEPAGPAAALFVVADEGAAHLWLDAEDVEKLRADFCAKDAGGAFFTGQCERAIAINRA